MNGNFDKVTINSSLSGAIVIVLLFLASLIFPSVEVPGEVGAALSVIIGGITGYFTNHNGDSSLNDEG